MIQNKRKNSCSSSCDTDHKPPPVKQFIRAANVASLKVVEQQPLPKSVIIPIDVTVTTALSMQSPDDGGSNSGGFQIKTDDTSSCDEDSESKFSASGHGVSTYYLLLHILRDKISCVLVVYLSNSFSLSFFLIN